MLINRRLTLVAAVLITCAASLTADYLETFENGFNDYPWQYNSIYWSIGTPAHNGTKAAVCNGLNDTFIQAHLQVTVLYDGTGICEFWYQTSTEAGHDFLEFYINGVKQDSWSGDISWTKASFPVPYGSVTLKWVYAKDASGSAGTDTVCVDDILLGFRANADAGPDQNAGEGDTVYLDGTGSTATLYSWTQTAGPAVFLYDRTTATPHFTAPSNLSAPATLTFRLSIDEGVKTDTVSVFVRCDPDADAGPDQAVNEGDTVTLNGGGSNDPNGTGIAYAWLQTAGTLVVLSNPAAVSPFFTAPDIAGMAEDLVFELTVTNGNSDTDSDSVTITDYDPLAPPIADAGPDQAVPVGRNVTLDGSGSFDPPPAETLTYAWTQDAGDAVTVVLTGEDTALPAFTAPDSDGSYDLHFTLTVSASTGSDADSVTIAVMKPSKSETGCMPGHRGTLWIAGLMAAAVTLGAGFRFRRPVGPSLPSRG